LTWVSKCEAENSECSYSAAGITEWCGASHRPMATEQGFVCCRFDSIVGNTTGRGSSSRTRRGKSTPAALRNALTILCSVRRVWRPQHRAFRLPGLLWSPGATPGEHTLTVGVPALFDALGCSPGALLCALFLRAIPAGPRSYSPVSSVRRHWCASGVAEPDKRSGCACSNRVVCC